MSSVRCFKMRESTTIIRVVNKVRKAELRRTKGRLMADGIIKPALSERLKSRKEKRRLNSEGDVDSGGVIPAVR